MRLDIPGVLNDIMIVFVYDDPALLEISKSGPSALDIGNF